MNTETTIPHYFDIFLFWLFEYEIKIEKRKCNF